MILGGTMQASMREYGIGKPPRRPMNLLFIMTDQQPVSTLGCYGNPLDPTPHLDGLAKKGLRLTNFYIGAFPCSPSRASILTGLYPQGHNVFTNNMVLADNIPSLGFLLRKTGYDTAYFGKSHLKGYMYRGEPGRQPFNGFWYYQGKPSPGGLLLQKIKGGQGEDSPQLGFGTWAGGWKQYHDYLQKAGLGDLLKDAPYPGNHNDLPSAPNSQHRYSLLSQEHHMASFFTQNAVRFLRSSSTKKNPFCLFLSYYGPHLPVAPPKPWNKKYSLGQCPLPANHHDTLEDKPSSQRENKYCYKLPGWNPRQFRDYIRRYYGYTSYIDSQIGRVLDTLKKSGLSDNTIVVFTSDHGDMMGAHGILYKMENSCYEEVGNVPFIISVPGTTRRASVSNGLVSSVDIFPTLLELLGLAPLKEVHGKSFAPLLRHPDKPFRSTLFIHWGPHSVVSFDGQWKYARHAKADTDELYNLRGDPGELKNLVNEKKYKALVKKKQQEIQAWLRETAHPYASIFRERDI
jgi:arylsulfatase A-like enzyme